MKTHIGFVSNSSSSSFILIANKKVFDEVIKNIHSYIKFLFGKPIIKKLGYDEIIIKDDFETTESWKYKIKKYEGEILNSLGNVIGFKKINENCNINGSMMTIGAFNFIYNKMNEYKEKSSIFFSNDC